MTCDKVDKTTRWPDISKGVWIDTPGRNGFREHSGIYLVLPGSNTAYGNLEGGFQSVRQAETYNRMLLDGEYKVEVRL